jgi:hypothetical protein
MKEDKHWAKSFRKHALLTLGILIVLLVIGVAYPIIVHADSPFGWITSRLSWLPLLVWPQNTLTLTPEDAEIGDIVVRWRSGSQQAVLDLDEGHSGRFPHEYGENDFLPSFVVRVERRADTGGILIAKSFLMSSDPSRGTPLGPPCERVVRQLTPDEMGEVVACFAHPDTWGPRSPDTVGMDGARWVVETATPGNYHSNSQWSPKRGKLRDCGLLMLDLSRLEIHRDLFGVSASTII